ncbi:aldehyde dehydrogenase (NAD+) [Maribacter vaceletii]|uniref:Aldehyde dehydrogenase n=1 Tax=Maribacter vaceletii TaxID=1206816 RepID=A0A495DWN2_9FLAO|nr:aldehyde dehydrogenase family protein [Maribacter vaceletii]RKR08007.1 aldehyde dehydrogenase (NAD+) [Maribacter vaceletii]
MSQFLNKFQQAFTLQKNNQQHIANSNYKDRIKKLQALKFALEKTYRSQICDALLSDFKKPVAETELTEIYPVLSEIKFAIKNLKKWTKKQKVTTPFSLIGSSSWIHYEPKGVCLLISPWNFPFNLTFGPLVSAIAAGNTVIIKPSELSPATSTIMQTIIANVFKENEITLIKGDATVSQELLKLPFNHIFFTGSPAIGKIVMKTAAENLTSVTLELGGKSPVIIDETANIEKAAKRIAWGKFINNGQVCVAPDYILISKKIEKQFLSALKNQIDTFYGEESKQSNSYCRIINKKHFLRLNSHLNDAKNKNATIAYGGVTNAEDNFISPTIITNLPSNASLLEDEIFGPILPIIFYENIEETIDYINSKSKPLALYVFSSNKKNTNFIIQNTRAGSTCINHVVLQYSNHNLPFGGSNTSGIGKAHGIYGFQEFSNMRSILKQHTISAIDFLCPPYTKEKMKLIYSAIRWF